MNCKTISQSHESWPLDGLESISQCPVCADSEREILYSNLVDKVFRVAPGEWTLWRCGKCNSAYLDPRPTAASISKAYETYYTHNAGMEREGSDTLGRFRLFRRALANGYLNERYGTEYQPTSRFGSVFAGLLSSQREALDAQFRWLPKPGPGHRLLDVGCGNGRFLSKARDAGWQVLGVDFDPNAVATARELGLEVHVGSIDIFDGKTALFDAITISHVIEHVHEPSELLSIAHRLLRPGGTLYLDTPNIQSLGAKNFGSNWRGIESPRHLVIFSLEGLLMLLQQSGFVDIELKPRRTVSKGMFSSSLRLMQESSSSGTDTWSLSSVISLRMYSPFLSESHLEFITLLAYKE